MGNTDKFEQIAGSYDTDERIQIAKLSADAIRGYLLDSKNKSAIDFGCGTGLVGMNLIQDFKSILFLDTSQNMLNQIKMKLPNANTLCVDLEKDDLDLHTDTIFMVQVLLHIKDYEAILSKLYNMLNPGGHLLLVDFNKNEKIDTEMIHNGFDQEELSRVMSNMGYQGIQSRTFHKASKILMGRDASLFILDSHKG